MKSFRLGTVIKILDKYYDKVACKLSRSQILDLDSLTVRIEYEDRKSEYYNETNDVGKKLASLGITRNYIETLLREYQYGISVEEIPNFIEEQIDILEQLLIPTGRINPIKFKESLRTKIRNKLSKMTSGRMDASLRAVKLGEKTIYQWADEPDILALRDAEYNNFMKGERT